MRLLKKLPIDRHSYGILEKMLFHAKQSLQRAYAPYSKFYVGASVLDSDGGIYSGCNVENASYPLCMCAERSAISNMVNSSGKEIKKIVIISSSLKPCLPCGACLQVIREFGDPDIFCVAGDETETLKVKASELLTIPFSLK